jgi:precorrin-8X/cobalt-precorrin-8 methylmutase
MARCAIPQRRLTPLGCSIACFMDDPAVAGRARREGNTRARAAVDHAAERMDGAILVVGNAPTALLRILEHVGPAHAPALWWACRWLRQRGGSKELLMPRTACPGSHRRAQGRLALAGSAVNALADMALDGQARAALRSVSRRARAGGGYLPIPPCRPPAAVLTPIPD